MQNILIVEDDKNLNKGLSIAFQDKYIIHSTFSLSEAKNFIDKVDLILLDMNLPDGDGLDLIKEIRKNYNTAIIVISAIDLESYIISAINLGADDYITKPFSLGILQAKIERLLNKNTYDNKIYSKDGIYFNFDENIFKVEENNISLSPTEEKILYFLVMSENKIITKEVLLEKIWGIDENFIDENTISVNISRLRGKLKPLNPIETVFGVGYKWNL
ncbi:response regulator transcription factor [Peptoniphilus sp. MSJ-1]|uniref:Response regulator transcription factor n=1 Tax=Peptoniphilus ovalis TaxID=2841503 RepID=A0ABS6FIN3_9FIRM|nr:response regulator transcription factor [Peptoniphilus ovalis]MBU5670029.1 response regulator transcription factor [Peptoniphilus ovalis]